MSDRLSQVPEIRSLMPDRPSRPTSALARAVTVLLVMAAAGAATGVLWEALWRAPTGVVYRERWILEPAGPDLAFSGTALYVVLALPVGFCVGVLIGLLRRHEAVTLACVLVGSFLAGWLLYAVGHALGPPDPRVLAAGETDYTRVPSDLVLAAQEDSASPFRSTAFVTFPAGSLAGLALVYISGSRTRPRR